MTESTVLESSLNQSSSDVYLKSTTNKNVSTGEQPTGKDYFEHARKLIVWTFWSMIVIFIITLIGECFFCIKIYDKAFAMVKDFIYPFLTLMIGYMFGKGFSNEGDK